MAPQGRSAGSEGLGISESAAVGQAGRNQACDTDRTRPPRLADRFLFRAIGGQIATLRARADPSDPTLSGETIVRQVLRKSEATEPRRPLGQWHPGRGWYRPVDSGQTQKELRRVRDRKRYAWERESEGFLSDRRPQGSRQARSVLRAAIGQAAGPHS
jgi:hypothetical protein